ncbi:hypothetical protein AB6A40_001205 [Gnathostoma spinigerum]|uniref:Uncharacterized protein n=1 Tax=Gnathostoma spinigerum TaxID=75299 RepID=A0ABD6E4W5_9BILA
MQFFTITRRNSARFSFAKIAESPYFDLLFLMFSGAFQNQTFNPKSVILSIIKKGIAKKSGDYCMVIVPFRYNNSIMKKDLDQIVFQSLPTDSYSDRMTMSNVDLKDTFTE